MASTAATEVPNSPAIAVFDGLASVSPSCGTMTTRSRIQAA
ncbi:hypothetical protein QQA02_10395 [Corynebacterium sp. MSK006]|nr:hypothetical protein [Corynebacterium sp. MSK006]MDK8896091.1 hypothetical protein [Corynebacterium sp. MSK006]